MKVSKKQPKSVRIVKKASHEKGYKTSVRVVKTY